MPAPERCPLCNAHQVAASWIDDAEDVIWMCGSRRWAPHRKVEQDNICRIRELEARQMVKLTDTKLINALVDNPHLRAHVENGDLVLYDERGTWEGRATNAGEIVKLLYDAENTRC